MIGKLDENLSFHSNALVLRSQRQQLLASNIANADTPGYQARDFDFAAALRAASGQGAQGTGGSAAKGVLRTSAEHMQPAGSVDGAKLQYRMAAQGSLDRNSVDMDTERALFADNAVRYEASLRFLNHQIKTMLSAIQG
jgi:flagellar basal-body rod protein FlgB